MLAEQALCRLNYPPLKQSAFDNSPTEKKKKKEQEQKYNPRKIYLMLDVQ